MKNPIIAFILLALTFACSTKKSEPLQEWKELDSFHEIMALAYHPLDSGNLQPAKELAGQLATEAEKLATSPIPAKVNNEKMKKDLESLNSVTHKLANQVKEGASDDIIKETLEGAHQQFHKIMGAWMGHHEEGEGHGDTEAEEED